MDDDFWGDFAIDYSGGTDALFNFGDKSGGGTFDISGALNSIGGLDTMFDARDYLDTSWLDNIVSGLDLKGGDASILDKFDFDALAGGYDFDPSWLGTITSGLDTSGGDASVLDQYDFDALAGQGGDAEAQEGGFYGNIPGVSEYDPRTNSTILYNPDGSIRDVIVHDEQIYDAEAQEGGFYGNTPNATYDPKTNTTTIRNDKGEVVRTVYHSGGAGAGTDTGKGGGGGGNGGGQGGANNFLKDNKALLALLGGILGLLSSKGGTTKPSGYKGGIPKYTATRGTPTAPTAEGRRPGGANIPSLTGGVTYTKAAGGGLMDLAQGGRAARYLRGGTDGMADKIETDIDGKQPARLSHGEFVIPADVVSHLGNGNSDAGADVLYDMMDKVRKARTGTTKQGKQINPRKMLPA